LRAVKVVFILEFCYSKVNFRRLRIYLPKAPW
jgi:hypothetical protein